jgi:hypothetical protein
MSETMSSSIAALAAALAKAQGAMTHASKDATNPHFKTRYADLAAVWAAIREPLAANGLAVVQTVTQSEGTVGVRSILAHASGEWVASDLQMPVAQKTPQGYGSALTYARRYSLAALVGIAQDDDDGEAGTRPVQPAQNPQRRQVPREAQPQAAETQRTSSEVATPAPSAAGEDPVEAAIIYIGEAETLEQLQALAKRITQLGVSKDPEVRQAYSARQQALKKGVR